MVVRACRRGQRNLYDVLGSFNVMSSAVRAVAKALSEATDHPHLERIGGGSRKEYHANQESLSTKHHYHRWFGAVANV
jgi:hypothetical protein